MKTRKSDQELVAQLRRLDRLNGGLHQFDEAADAIERLEDEVKRWRFVAELFAECDPYFRPMKAYFEEFSRET